MKKSLIRVALSFATFNDDQLNSAAVVLIACLKNNALFPDLPITIAAFTALQLAFQNAMAASAIGGVMDTATKNEARDALIIAMRQLAFYVQSVGLDSAAEVLSSGFDIISTSGNKVPTTLDTPVLMGLDNSVSTQLQMRLQAVSYAKAYEVQFNSAGGTWQSAGIFPNTRGIAIEPLTPGTVYSARVRAIGGATRYSDWSATVSLMST